MSSISAFIRLVILFWKNRDTLEPVLKLSERLPKIGDELKKNGKFTSDAGAMLKTTVDMLGMPKSNTVHLIKQTQNQVTNLVETFGTAGSLLHTTENYVYCAGKVFRLEPPLFDDEIQCPPL